jgi:hypothetical protein
MLLYLPIDILDDYLNNTIYKNVKENIEYNNEEKVLILSIYNIVVGSYMSREDILTPNHQYKRNHECPQFVKNILYNFESQITPDFLEYISNYKKIIIRQYLILIDDMYNKENYCIGLCSEFPNILKDGNYIIEYNIQYNQYNTINIESSIEPVIVPSFTNVHQICEILKQLSNNVSRIPLLVNIMDCTSNMLINLFVNNTNLNIYLSKPDCLLCDSKLEYMPMITFDINNQIRWANYNLDSSMIPNLLQVKDVCSKSENTLNFLKNLYKVNAVNISFVSIYKMFRLFTITKTYTLQSGKNITFNDLTFNNFIKLWSEPDFPNLITYNFDPYFEHNIKYYMNSLVHNQIILTELKNNTSVKDILLQEANKIINKLNEYFPENLIILKDNNLNTISDTIRDYVQENGTYF